MTGNVRILEKDIAHLTRRQCVRFSLFCAYQVKYLWRDHEKLIKEVKLIEEWLNGSVTLETYRATNKIQNIHEEFGECKGAAAAVVFYTSNVITTTHKSEISYVNALINITHQYIIEHLGAHEARWEWLKSHSVKGVTDLILKEKP